MLLRQYEGTLLVQAHQIVVGYIQHLVVHQILVRGLRGHTSSDPSAAIDIKNVAKKKNTLNSGEKEKPP